MDAIQIGSFKISLEFGYGDQSSEYKERYCREKNDIYIEYIRQKNTDEIIPGTNEILTDAKPLSLKPYCELL